MSRDAIATPGAGSPPMRLWYGTVPARSLEELLDAAVHSGFTEIVPTPGMVLDAVRSGQITTIRDRMRQSGVAVTMIDPLVSPLPGMPSLQDIPAEQQHFFEATLADALDAAEALGAKTVCAAPFRGTAAPRAETVEAVGAIAIAARDRGLRVAIEFMPGSCIPDFTSAIEICDAVELAAPHLSDIGIVFDTWHFARSGGTSDVLRAAPLDRIYAVQFADRIEPAPSAAYVPMADRLLPGEGELPLAEWASIIRAAQRDLIFGVEVFSSVLRAMSPREAAVRAGRSMRDLLAGTA